MIIRFRTGRLPMKTLIIVLLLIPAAASAYGNRNWLSTNQFYNKDISDNTYSWGYNYHSRGRHTTIRLEEDKSGWMHNGNMRNGDATGTYHWDKVHSPR